MIISIILTTIYVIASLTLGLFILRLIFRTRLESYSSLVVVTTSFLLGQSLLVCLWIFLGLMGWLAYTVVVAVVVLSLACGLILRSDLIRLKQSVFFKIKEVLVNLSLSWKIIIITLILSVIALGLMALLEQPTGDAEAFYMVLPKIIAHTGKLIAQPNYYDFSKLSLIGEMHYAVLMIISNAASAKFLVWFEALAAAGMLLSLGSIYKIKGRGVVITLSLLFSSGCFIDYIYDGKIDIFGAVLGLAAYFWALQFNGKKYQEIALAGLFLGFAIAAKLSNALVILPGILLIICWNSFIGAEGLKFILKLKQLSISLALLLFFVVVAFIPQFIKNQIIFGNFLASNYSVKQTQAWMGPVWTQSKTNQVEEVVQNSENKKEKESLKTLLVETSNQDKITATNEYNTGNPVINTIKRIPFLIVTSPLAFVLWQYPGKGGNLSILVLALLPFVFFRRSFSLPQKQLLTMALLGIFIWLSIRSFAIAPRYIMATLLTILPFIASSVENFLEKNSVFFLKITISAILLLTLLASFFSQSPIISKAARILTGNLKQEALYGSNYVSLNFINQKVQKDERVFLLGYYSFYLKPEILVNIDNDEEKKDMMIYVQPNPWEYLYDHNFKYVIIQKSITFPVTKVLLSDSRPNWLNIQRIYSDASADIYSIEKK